jgi:hypothetical protein
MEELDRGYQLIEGTKAILVVAAHNFRQGREGIIKGADLGTGEIVRKICKKFNIYGLVSTREQMDPNWYPHSNFREEVKEIIKTKKIELVIDIHGRILSSPNLVEIVANKIFQEKYKIITRDFVNSSQENLVEEMEGVIPAVEVEIREDGRVPTVDEVKYREAEKIINELMEKLINEN